MLGTDLDSQRWSWPVGTPISEVFKEGGEHFWEEDSH